VFAPTNGAFDDADIDPTMTSTDTLAAVLSHHAVVGQALSTSLEDGQVITTLNGDITVNIDGDDVTLTDGAGNTVNVIATDIRTLTGVVHLIDGVLIPE
ncbi:MAG: fasciclin domain-containing protein, partial [Myxococcota bacterium]